MSELISINQRELNGAIIQAANARELHAFLGNGARFNDWIKKRIRDYGFLEHVDYVRVELSAGTKMAERGGRIGGVEGAGKNVALESMGYASYGQQGRIEYAISIDMAKELSMVERNAKGKEARQYFLECERKAKAPADPVAMLNDPATMRGLLLSYSEKVLALEGQNNAMRPKVDALDRIATADGSMCITDAAKLLQMRPKDLFDWLHRHKWTHRRRGKSGWIAYQERLQNGFLEHKVTTVECSDGTEKIVEQVRILPKGLAKLAESVVQA
jgi:anti-repressor protein